MQAAILRRGRRSAPSSSQGVEGGACEGRELADAALVLGGEVGSVRLVGELEEPIVAAVIATDRRGQPARQWWVLGGLVTESGPVGMGLYLFLCQARQ
jgi:hypothetical protein